MNYIEEGYLAKYNSLLDPNLAGYFSNTNIRRHLKKTKLLTRRGEVVTERSFRLINARSDHRSQLREMLAKAILNKALETERRNQAEAREKLELIAKTELVKRVKAKGRDITLPQISVAKRQLSSSISVTSSSQRDDESIYYKNDKVMPTRQRFLCYDSKESFETHNNTTRKDGGFKSASVVRTSVRSQLGRPSGSKPNQRGSSAQVLITPTWKEKSAKQLQTTAEKREPSKESYPKSGSNYKQEKNEEASDTERDEKNLEEANKKEEEQHEGDDQKEQLDIQQGANDDDRNDPDSREDNMEGDKLNTHPETDAQPEKAYVNCRDGTPETSEVHGTDAEPLEDEAQETYAKPETDEKTGRDETTVIDEEPETENESVKVIQPVADEVAETETEPEADGKIDIQVVSETDDDPLAENKADTDKEPVGDEDPAAGGSGNRDEAVSDHEYDDDEFDSEENDQSIEPRTDNN